MSKRPRIKQADGSLLDLPLDAETIKGKTLEEIALKTDIPTLKTINGESIVGSGNIVIQGGGGSGDLSNYVTKDEGLSKDGTATLNAHSSNEFYTLVTASDIACINYSASTVPGKHTPSTYYFGNGTGASGMKSGVIYAGNIYQNDKQVANKDDVVDLTSVQTITGAKAFTGQVGNIQSESGVYLGLDTNTAAPNANIAITSANSAAYIDMGKPNHDYDFRLIKWDNSNGNVAQMCYNTEDGGTSANITIPRASGTLALTGDIPARVSTSASSYSHIDYISTENANSTYQVAFTNNDQSYGICWSKFANITNSAMTPSACTYNGFFYVASSTNSLSGADANPFLQYHSSASDFRILTTAYSDQWLQQIATDFRSPYIYVRRRENGSWSSWTRVLTTDDAVEIGRIHIYDDGRSYSIDVSRFSYVEISMIYNDSPGKTLTFTGGSYAMYEDSILDFRISVTDDTCIYIKDGTMFSGGSLNGNYFTMQLQGYNDSSHIEFVYRGYK